MKPFRFVLNVRVCEKEREIYRAFIVDAFDAAEALSHLRWYGQNHGFEVLPDLNVLTRKIAVSAGNQIDHLVGCTDINPWLAKVVADAELHWGAA